MTNMLLLLCVCLSFCVCGCACVCSPAQVNSLDTLEVTIPGDGSDLWLEAGSLEDGLPSSDEEERVNTCTNAFLVAAGVKPARATGAKQARVVKAAHHKPGGQLNE